MSEVLHGRLERHSRPVRHGDAALHSPRTWGLTSSDSLGAGCALKRPTRPPCSCRRSRSPCTRRRVTSRASSWRSRRSAQCLRRLAVGIAAGALRREPFAVRARPMAVLCHLGARDRQVTIQIDLAALVVRYRGEHDRHRAPSGLAIAGRYPAQVPGQRRVPVSSHQGLRRAERCACTIAGAFAAYSVVRLVTVVEITPGLSVLSRSSHRALTYVTKDAYHTEIVAGVLLFRVVTYIAPIPAGAVAYVFWRMKKSWRVDVPPHNRRPGLVSALVDERPPRE